MSDEIDIEEHDVLDNPTIRRIFPDLSVIKKEITDYEVGIDTTLEEPIQEAKPCSEHVNEETLDVKPFDYIIVNSATHISANRKPEENTAGNSNKRLAIHQTFRKFLDSLAEDVSEISDSSNTQPSIGSQYNNNDNLSSSLLHFNETFENSNNHINRFQNMFIFGSKPSLIKSENSYRDLDKKEPKILLKNVSNYLKRSKRYCKCCLILFPTIAALKCHMTTTHSHRVTSMTQKNLLRLKSMKKFKCDICTINLSSKGNLVRHFKMVHKRENNNGNVNRVSRISLRRNNKSHEMKMSLKRDTTITGSNAPLKDRKLNKNVSSNDFKTKLAKYSCFHCKTMFDTQSSLIEHLYDIIKPNKVELNNATKTDQVIAKHDINKSVNCNNITKSKHIECPICAIKCLTQKQLAQHNKKYHMNRRNLAKNRHYIGSNSQKTNNLLAKMERPKLVKGIKRNKKSEIHNTDLYMKINEALENNTSTSKLYSNNSSDHNSGNNSESDSQISTFDNSVNLIDNGQIYQCYICAQYIINLEDYNYHLDGHNIKEISEVDKVIFNSQCQFCSLKRSTIKSYNCHMLKFHREKIEMKIELDQKAFQSVLFKCFKCDVYFLTVNAAMAHYEHDKIFANWTCLDCNKLFKMKDKAIHMKQHSLSENIIAYALSDSSMDKVLFKCLKCTIHFSEKEYFLHTTTCGLEIPNSIYCNTCDILVNKNDMDLHDYCHKHKVLKLCDFTFVESDIIINDVIKQEVDKKNNPHAKSKFALTFCHSCNSFLGNIGGQNKAHLDGRCRLNVLSRMCRICGLTFTYKGFYSHKILHDTVKKLNLQSFYFYDIKSKEQIRPPVPKYPNCNVCHVHFLEKRTVKEHECDLQDFIVCKICKTKLTDAAYKLHKLFHNYDMSRSSLNKKINTSFKPEEIIALSSSSSKYVTKIPLEDDILNNSPSMNTEKAKEEKVLYTCVTCHVTVDMYDKVIQHCHDHYSYEKIRYDDNDKLYPCNNDVAKSININTIKFDPFYFRFNNEVWSKHVFGNFTEEHIKNILKHSMYKYECRLKMEEIQSGNSDVVLYKCDMCSSYISPNELYVHARDACDTSKKETCSHCGLCFYTPSFRMIHEQIHAPLEVNTTMYKIILYNKMEHQEFTKMMVESCNKYILYQCRNCDGIVDKLQRDIHKCKYAQLKKCSYCGLLIYDQEYNLHVIKHEEFINFHSEHMVIIMFGKSEYQNDYRLKSSFNGTIYDLTFYKCTNCELCLKSEIDTFQHICVIQSAITQCPKCFLCFLKQELEKHFELHENLDLRYDDFHSNVISFKVPSIKKEIPDIANEVESITQNTFVEKHGDANENEHLGSDMIQKIYKCPCGLHFVQECNAKKHLIYCNPKMKASKQRCIKCHLLFTPGELFDHLLVHHGDKKMQYKYDINEIAKGNENN